MCVVVLVYGDRWSVWTRPVFCSVSKKNDSLLLNLTWTGYEYRHCVLRHRIYLSYERYWFYIASFLFPQLPYYSWEPKPALLHQCIVTATIKLSVYCKYSAHKFFLHITLCRLGKALHFFITAGSNPGRHNAEHCRCTFSVERFQLFMEMPPQLFGE